MICTRLKQRFANIFKVFVALICISFACHSHAQNFGDDDTILVEQSPNIFNCYKSAVKAFSKQLLDVYIDDFFASSVSYKDSVIRNFSELASRTKYKVNLKQDKVELKLTLNF